MAATNTGKYRAEKPEPTTSALGTGQTKEDNSEIRLREALKNDAIDEKYGFKRVQDHLERTGFLINMHSNEILDHDKKLNACVDYYFIEEDGKRFKVSLPFKPYFYILVRKENIQEVNQFLMKKYAGVIVKIENVLKEDLDLPNHLIGLKQRYMKLTFCNMTDLIKVRREILSYVRKNREKQKANTYYNEMLTKALVNKEEISNLKTKTNHFESIVDTREYDVPYHVRVSIDMKIFCGSWYTIRSQGSRLDPIITKRDDLIERPDPIVLAFDIETTKLPLKFPDASTDQIMMISYMIDGQGYLIINREIVSSDIEDFEYTPKPEYEGLFKIFNEADERDLINRFFSHILEIRPHIFVTYNGDFFDWMFVETRAAVYNIDMKQEIGFSKGTDGVYTCRPAMHMDCLCWVKRDSYLPVGSQNLKAVAKAKLRYDPVELDPEDMCQLAAEQPEVLANYSVSDAVATYYLYMKYVHPFIFALCTIIPTEPDEVLRKGSGTLCEALLMVEAFHGNIIFPNKQESELNKLTEDGHVLHTETYVGGHVEALESGVFRADIPCRFRMVAEAFDKLISNIDKTLTHAIEVEEGIPLSSVTNFDEIKHEIVSKLEALRDHPNRMENPIIYHLDVGAMYPNIILTNRLQPCAMVDETFCAACDFNRPGAVCQRNMSWMWRGEYMPASRSEYHRIQQQLETEKFPPKFPGGPQRAFHQLSREDQAEYEKKRLSDYCRKAYKKVKVTTTTEKTTTICQKENSFYVDTVRAFRDRRYEYKGLSKKAKQAVSVAVASKNAAEIKSAKNREVLYDSLQLAHKCILNSFYGYVMRRGARWHSMEMAGIVCYTGAHIIMKAREIIEQVGRPLELDTDGIWCVLPASFPENVDVLTTHEKKRRITISYPNAVLNEMVKEHFTNDQYHDLVDAATLEYKIHNENSIFFEVDGPYRAMVLPASKEEGKKLKKRYAVFNFDGSLAELKGFEVKRRGELQLIKIFQSSVFDAFLKGDSLETCYASVAKVADYWLDVLFSRGRNMPDSELFELISENRSMSKKLEEYGQQKSTSISTAKRLAEFLGDQMVKDKGLACRFIISRKPDGAPVTERAIPLAIFQSEEAVQKHYLRKWLKDSSLAEFDIRDILDWNYYIERLGGAIQKIITIPAAMQGLANPVPRVKHPDWLHKKVLEKNDLFKQRKISDMFSSAPKPVHINNEMDTEEVQDTPDIEDLGGKSLNTSGRPLVTMTTSKRKRKSFSEDIENEDMMQKSWKEALGPPPPKTQIREWILYQKKKWAWQAKQRAVTVQQTKRVRQENNRDGDISGGGGVVRSTATLGGFLKRSQRTLLNTPWQIIQIANTNAPGEFKLWALVGQELHHIRLIVPRIFYVNLRVPKEAEVSELWKKCNRVLPRARTVHNLYRYSVPESMYLEHGNQMFTDLTDPKVEGIYETQITLIFRALLELGCVCSVNLNEIKNQKETDVFSLEQLSCKSVSQHSYLSRKSGCNLRYLYMYHYKATTGSREMFGLFLSPIRKALIIVVDSVRTNLMPNMSTLYTAERIIKVELNKKDHLLPPEDMTFEVRVETDHKLVYRLIQRALQSYRDEKKGPSLLAIQSNHTSSILQSNMPELSDFPQVTIHVQDIDNLYNTLEWQRVGAKAMVRHYLNSDKVLELMLEQSRYFHVPLGNMPADPTLFGSDLFYARHLQKNNFVLWVSKTGKPDLGGSEMNDARLLAEFQQSSSVCNTSGCYTAICVELDIDSLAVNTLLQSHHVNDIEGTSSSIAFDAAPKVSIDNMVQGTPMLPTYDDIALCSEAFKVLKFMVNAWLRDVSIHRNMFADFQIVHFYRWLRSPKALLYDPAILRTLQNLMSKLFMQLVAEFKRLGSIIVFANFNKIVVCTKKHTITDAIGYVEFVVKSIRNKELFHSIEISYNRCWEYLMWLDDANYGGVLGRLPDGLASVGESQIETENLTENGDDEDEDDDGPIIIMNWNLMEHLPEAAGCRKSFKLAVAGYISAIFQHMQQQGPEALSAPRPVIAASQSQSQVAVLGVGAINSLAEFAQKLITDEMSQKLFQITEKINRKLPKQPVSALSVAASGSSIQPALEFIKAICHVLALDPAVEDAVLAVKRNMLRLIAVGEYSSMAEWHEPSVSYVLPGLICRSCNHCRDIDLGRDNHQNVGDDGRTWFCPVCKTEYDNSEIEDSLLEIVTRRMIAYNLQDLQCKKCGEIKMDNLATYCSCAGSFTSTISESELVKLLNTFHKIGNAFHMELLTETVDSLIAFI